MGSIRRVIAGAGALAVCAGFVLAGSASSAPSISAGKLSGVVKFTASVILGSTTYTIDSTSCTEKIPGAGPAVSCFLGGSGALNGNGKIVTADLAVTSGFGNASASLSSLNTCGVGSGVFVTAIGPVPIAQFVAITDKWTTASTVTATIDAYNPGNKTITCDRAKAST